LVGAISESGLPTTHPILKFIEDTKSLDRALELDDSVFWGVLPMLIVGKDAEIARLAVAIRERKLLKCFDLKEMIDAALPSKAGEKREQRQVKIKVACETVAASLKEKNPNDRARFLVDQYSRNPYKRFQDSKTPLNQILIRVGDGPPRDMAEFSPIIGHAETFTICRVYYFRDDTDATAVIENEMRTKLKEIGDADA